MDPIPYNIRWAVWMAQMEFHVERFHPEWLPYFEYWKDRHQKRPKNRALHLKIARQLDKEWGYTH